MSYEGAVIAAGEPSISAVMSQFPSIPPDFRVFHEGFDAEKSFEAGDETEKLLPFTLTATELSTLIG